MAPFQDIFPTTGENPHFSVVFPTTLAHIDFPDISYHLKKYQINYILNGYYLQF